MFADEAKMKNYAKAWLIMQYHRIEENSIGTGTKDQINNYYVVPDKESGSELGDCSGGLYQLKGPVGHLATEADDGHIQIGGPNGGERDWGRQDCLENRKDAISPVATLLGFGSGEEFYSALGYNERSSESKYLDGPLDKSLLARVLFESGDFWGAQPKGNFNGGSAPDFVKYTILIDAIDRCDLDDNLFALKKPDGQGGSVWLYNNGQVEQYEIKEDSGKKITVGRGVGVGEDGEGKLSCGRIKQQLHNRALAEAYKTAIGLSSNNPENGGTTEGEGEEGAGEDDDAPTCVIEGVGWLVCPVARFIAYINDEAYGVVRSLMTYDLLTTGDGSDRIQKHWSNMRNVANVIFIIALLAIVYAQITNAGLSNYGIKKMVPRLIAFAVIVNVSFWICAVAVDMSNVAGASLYEVLTGADKGANPTVKGKWETEVSNILAGTIVAGAAGVGLAVAAFTGLYATLAFMLPLLLSALLALAIAVLMLVARQAIITILIVISPIAFALALLPNTEKYFDKWKGLFISMLIMFPIMGIVFGGSSLAANIIWDTSDSTMSKILGLAVASLPVASVWFIQQMFQKTLLGGAQAMMKSKGGQLTGKLGDSAKSGLHRRGQIAGARRIANMGGVPTTRRGRAWASLRGGKAYHDANKKFKGGVADQMVADNFRIRNAQQLQQDGYAESLTGNDQRMAGLLRAQAMHQEREEEKKMQDAYGTQYQNMSAHQILAEVAGVTMDENQNIIINDAQLTQGLRENGNQIAAALKALGDKDTAMFDHLGNAVLRAEQSPALRADQGASSGVASRAVSSTLSSSGLIGAGTEDAMARGAYTGSIEGAIASRIADMSNDAIAGLSPNDIGHAERAINTPGHTQQSADAIQSIRNTHAAVTADNDAGRKLSGGARRGTLEAIERISR